MKNVALTICSLALFLFCAMPVALAQGASRGPDPTTVRDPELEKESKHNLEVARHYFKLKKAYRAAIGRCEEIIAGNPNFARIDEVLYIAGASSLYLSQNRGKQAPTLAADKLRDDAREYWSRLVNEFPNSDFRERAENELRSLGGLKPKDQKAEGAKQ
ncbi:MAG: outer membrane protein assembly factor BamD [Pyrinomonadaceae bacterium]|nr:outer membrane protein assembly factor BamD [Pyrinomonadaceae bacterium]